MSAVTVDLAGDLVVYPNEEFDELTIAPLIAAI
jgi:hypothetical protein